MKFTLKSDYALNIIAIDKPPKYELKDTSCSTEKSSLLQVYCVRHQLFHGAAGITLLSETERNPLYTTTYGVGEVIRDAIARGCRHFIIGIGGSATNDGGIGMLQALGFDLLDQEGVPVRHGALGLRDLAVISDSHVLPELKECTFRIACDVTNPLCGPHGCSAVFGPQKAQILP